ncbi:Na+/H+ antiporter NhaC family protein [Bacillus taeanensis]|uniref:Na+/H+ antiporter NhaC-like C-terminal domain-containing protein n=1 Tax=Bacillus taeanensis TaxID=273032 RepID=A0A366XVL7_9BACI|nr:Na+/H+ antiporter NhaC family protein [Bacillus taeanensis]RBW70182.1 hypothetical protein DS031_08315 [Bacillus taeanensis]
MEIWFSILPSIIAIILAIWTKQVIPSLLAGLWFGSWIVADSFLQSFNQTISYVIGVLTDPNNMNVLLFLYIFSGFVSLIQVSGGIQAFAKLMAKYLTNSKRTLAALWGLLPITFIDCGFRVVATGSIIKPIAEKQNISKERMAYMLNNSASPVIILIPFATTFVGYVLGVIEKGVQVAGIEGSAFSLFIRSLPFNFFSYLSILIALLSIVPMFNFGKMKSLLQKSTTSHRKEAFGVEFSEEFDHKEKAHTAKDQTGNAMKGSMEHDHDMDEKSVLKPRLVNLIFPLAVLIPLSFFLMMGSDEPARSMLVALAVTSLATAFIYRFQGIKLKTLMDRFFKGGNKLIVTITILAVAWPLSDVSQDLGRLIETTLGENLSSNLVPVLLFIVTGAVAYFIGSSWGSWALMMPIGMTLAVTTGGSVPIVIAAVLSGGTFDDVTSPVSGMTAMSAGIAEADHMKYVKAMSPYNFAAASLAAVLFLAVPWVL